MYVNLALVFICIWFFIGFIGYGIRFKQEPIADNLRIPFLILAMIYGFPILCLALRHRKYRGLRFW